MKKVSIFGATGSVGSNSCKIIAKNLSRYKVVVLSANKNYKKLAYYSRILKAKYAVIKDKNHYKSLSNELSGTNVKCLSGEEELINLASLKTDLTIASIVGIAGLKSAYNSIGFTKNLALANKEALVCSGKIFMNKARKMKTKIIPLDSEHNALYQLLENNDRQAIKNIILTASGGPFWNQNVDLAKVTVREAVKHPNWRMGKKISIDSATMINKVLEKIEASILFNLELNKIDIILHPSSIVHGIVNFIDGNSIMLFSKPDMKIPINVALNWPKRLKTNEKCIDLKKISQLKFYDIKASIFPSLNLFNYLNNNKEKYSRFIALNSSNELAVDGFLKKKISYIDIINVIKNTLEKFSGKNPRNINDVFEIHKEASKIALSFINNCRN